MHLEHKNTIGRLPTSVFVLMDEGEPVGFVQVRHKPSHGASMPPECASHIYYEVEEGKRRKGYGTKLLELAKTEAARIGLSEIIVVCSDQNAASRRIIERNGGIFDLSATDSEGDLMLKYRLSLER